MDIIKRPSRLLYNPMKGYIIPKFSTISNKSFSEMLESGVDMVFSIDDVRRGPYLNSYYYSRTVMVNKIFHVWVSKAERKRILGNEKHSNK